MQTHIGGLDWVLADPYDTQERDHHEVPNEAGLYLWLRRSTPGMNPGATEDVLYVGRSKNLRDRLHRYSAVTYTREDPVLRALFDRVVAPGLDCEQLRRAIIGRMAPGLAQMWLRDHVVFAWTPWDRPGVGITENRLRAELRPWLNGVRVRWTAYNSTGHGDHDLTLPILPIPGSH